MHRAGPLLTLNHDARNHELKKKELRLTVMYVQHQNKVVSDKTIKIRKIYLRYRVSHISLHSYVAVRKKNPFN